MGVWQFLAAVWGWVLPTLIEFASKKVEGFAKVAIVIVFCLISGAIAGIIENGLAYNWSDIGEIFKFAAIVLVASQVAWQTTWHTVFEKIEYNKMEKQWDSEDSET